MDTWCEKHVEGRGGQQRDWVVHYSKDVKLVKHPSKVTNNRDAHAASGAKTDGQNNPADLRLRWHMSQRQTDAHIQSLRTNPGVASHQKNAGSIVSGTDPVMMDRSDPGGELKYPHGTRGSVITDSGVELSRSQANLTTGQTQGETAGQMYASTTRAASDEDSDYAAKFAESRAAVTSHDHGNNNNDNKNDNNDDNNNDNNDNNNNDNNNDNNNNNNDKMNDHLHGYSSDSNGSNRAMHTKFEHNINKDHNSGTQNGHIYTCLHTTTSLAMDSLSPSYKDQNDQTSVMKSDRNSSHTAVVSYLDISNKDYDKFGAKIEPKMDKYDTADAHSHGLKAGCGLGTAGADLLVDKDYGNHERRDPSLGTGYAANTNMDEPKAGEYSYAYNQRQGSDDLSVSYDMSANMESKTHKYSPYHARSNQGTDHAVAAESLLQGSAGGGRHALPKNHDEAIVNSHQQDSDKSVTPEDMLQWSAGGRYKISSLQIACAKHVRAVKVCICIIMYVYMYVCMYV